MKELKNKSVENVLWFLGELSAGGSDLIESDDFEVGCNDGQFCTVSIVDLAEDAKAIISKLTNEAANKWLSVGEPMQLDDGGKVWALWCDGKVEIATYIDDICMFQRRCGTNENEQGWTGNVGEVTHYQVIEKPLPNKCKQ